MLHDTPPALEIAAENFSPGVGLINDVNPSLLRTSFLFHFALQFLEESTINNAARDATGLSIAIKKQWWLLVLLLVLSLPGMETSGQNATGKRKLKEPGVAR